MKKNLIVLLFFFSICCEGYSQSGKDISIYRGDSTLIEFKVNGNIISKGIVFVVKLTKSFTSPRLIQKRNLIAGGSSDEIITNYSAPQTKVIVKLGPEDTQDLEATTYYYDIVAAEPTNLSIYYTFNYGKFTFINGGDIQTPFDGTSLPNNGLRITTVNLPNGSINNESVKWDTSLKAWVPSGTAIVGANNNLLIVGKDQEYSTITDAINHFTPGKIIYLMPEYFNEDIAITADSVIMMGENQELSKIKSLIVNGSDFHLENITINGNATFISQEPWDWFAQGIYLKHVTFRGNLNIGTQTTTLLESITSYDCEMQSNNYDLTINTYAGNNHFYNFRIQPISSDVTNDVFIYGGDLRFSGSAGLFIDTIYYKTAGAYSILGFYNLSPFAIKSIQTVTSTAFHVLVVSSCNLALGSSTLGNFTFNGKFELDIMLSTVSLWKNLIFNSTGNSRIQGFQQKGFSSTTTISGTGLNYLRIYQSIWKCSSPAGLAADINNIWNAYIDN